MLSEKTLCFSRKLKSKHPDGLQKKKNLKIKEEEEFFFFEDFVHWESKGKLKLV